MNNILSKFKELAEKVGNRFHTMLENSKVFLREKLGEAKAALAKFAKKHEYDLQKLITGIATGDIFERPSYNYFDKGIDWRVHSDILSPSMAFGPSA